MRCDLRFQDPSSEDTVYLYEQIIRELEAAQTSRFEGIFAFASRQGITSLLEDPDFERFLSRGGGCTLIVGMDAITDDRALALLESLCARHSTLEVMVFHNDIADLFHPKVARFFHDDGGQTIIIGSGNLTPGGLRRNIEAYSVTAIEAMEIGQEGSVHAWDAFVERHSDRIRPIDEATKAAARANRAARRRRQLGETEPEDLAAEQPVPEEAIAVEEAAVEGAALAGLILRDDQRMLLAQVPRAGGRWHQVHFNEAAIQEYFRMQPDSSDRAFLYEIAADGAIGSAEVRKCVYSRVNVNHKIEFAAHHGMPYPTVGAPILVLREIAHHTHRYRMLMPGEPGYSTVAELLASKPVLGRGPTPRAIVSAAEVKAVWPDCQV